MTDATVDDRRNPDAEASSRPDRQTVAVVDLAKIDAAALDCLARAGLSLDFLEAGAADDMATELAMRRQLGADLAVSASPLDVSEIAELCRRTSVRPWLYQESFFACGGIPILDPATGQVLVSAGSYALDSHHIVYRFEGRQPFYLMLGRWRGERIALLFPETNLVVLYRFSERTDAVVAWTVKLKAQFDAAVLANPDPFVKSWRTRQPARGLQLGLRPNLGHFVWQELSGVERLSETGRLENIEYLLVGPHEPFDIQKVFPELSHCQKILLPSEEEAFATGLTVPSQFLRPIGVQISPALRGRILRLAEASIGATIKTRIHAAAAQNLLIWFNLRAHNKIWRNQIEGYAAIANALFEDVPQLAVVLDGWTDTSEIANGIRAALNPQITCYDTTGCSLHESVVWANAVQLYVSVVGSGLVLNSWLADKPGFAHANNGHLAQRHFWNSVSATRHKPIFLTEAALRSDPAYYGDYDFDWRLAAEALRDLAMTHYPERFQQRNAA